MIFLKKIVKNFKKMSSISSIHSICSNIPNAYHYVCSECQIQSLNILKERIDNPFCYINPNFEEEIEKINYCSLSFQDLKEIISSEDNYVYQNLSLNKKYHKKFQDFNATVIAVTRILKHDDCYNNCKNKNAFYSCINNTYDKENKSLLEFAVLEDDVTLFSDIFYSPYFFLYHNDEIFAYYVDTILGKAIILAFLKNKETIIDFIFSLFSSKHIKEWFIPIQTLCYETYQEQITYREIFYLLQELISVLSNIDFPIDPEKVYTIYIQGQEISYTIDETINLDECTYQTTLTKLETVIEDLQQFINA